MKTAPAAALLALALAPSSVAAVPYAWDLSTVDPAPQSGNSLSLRLEPSGVPHVAFWTIGVGVRHGVLAGGAWTLETLPGAGTPPGVPAAIGETNLLQHTSVGLALAPGGAPWIAQVDHGRISHSDAGPIAVRHVESGAWVTEWLGLSGTPVAIEVDPGGVVHLAWGTGTAVLYSRRTAPGSWATETAYAGGTPNAFALRPDGSVHLAVTGPDGLVHHVVRAPAGGWSETPVAAPVIAGYLGACDLAFEPAGELAILTLERDPLFPRTQLRLHRRSGGTWIPEDVDIDPTMKLGGVLEFDASGLPLVAYRREAEDRFVLATPVGPGPWTWSAIDTVGGAEFGISGAFDAIGRPWFVTANQSLGVRLAIGQQAVDVPTSRPPVDAAWLGAPIPQPSRRDEAVRLAVAMTRPGPLAIEWVDVTGAVRRQETHGLAEGATRVVLSTRDLAPGVWWIRARDAAGRTAARRLVIARGTR